jgi:C-terminal processing protease CtpA/Prc
MRPVSLSIFAPTAVARNPVPPRSRGCLPISGICTHGPNAVRDRRPTISANRRLATLSRPPPQPFTRPVVCLIGPGCVSSGEGFALMMKAMDHVTLVGQPTRGASGNPHPVTLSNGVKVWFSRWVAMEPDGTPIEGRGIQPDVTVEHMGEGDPTFDKAVEILREKTGIGPM